MPSPADYINVSQIKPPPKRTLRADIKTTIGRFGRQQFRANHVFWVLLEDQHYKNKNRHSLYASVRPEIKRLVDDGMVEVVTRGRTAPGHGNVYRAIQSKAS